MERIVLLIAWGKIRSDQMEKLELNSCLIFSSLSPVLCFVFSFTTLPQYKNHFFTETLVKGNRGPRVVRRLNCAPISQ